MADSPQDATNKSQQAKPSVDFDAVFGNAPRGPRANTDTTLPPSRQLPPPVERTDIIPRGKDQVEIKPVIVAETGEKFDLKFSGRALELSYNDPSFEKKLSFAGKNNAKDFDTLKLTDIPPGVKIAPWVDSNGFFFWFNDGSGKKPEKHYIPKNLNTLQAAETTDLNKVRPAIMQAYNEDISKRVTTAGGAIGGFKDFDRSTDPARDGAASAFQYFRGVGALSDQALDRLELTLRDGVRTSDNPYLKIWLADVYVGQAMRGVINRALSGEPVDLKDPYLIKKFDDAISLNKAARLSSDNTMENQGMKRQMNQYMPMAPFNPYWDPRNRNGYYGFWGGAGDQAAYREAALTTIKNMIQVGAIPKLQLPPAMPPKRAF